jgi:hypothetical protein
MTDSTAAGSNATKAKQPQGRKQEATTEVFSCGVCMSLQLSAAANFTDTLFHKLTLLYIEIGKRRQFTKLHFCHSFGKGDSDGR